MPCPPRPLGGAAPGGERGKRGRAGRLSSRAREAAAAEQHSAAAAHLLPPAGRSGGGEAGGSVPPEGDGRGKVRAGPSRVGGGAAGQAYWRAPRAPGLGAAPTSPGAMPGAPHPRCGVASRRSCPRRVGGSGSRPEQPRAVPVRRGQGQRGGAGGSAALGPARSPCPPPTTRFCAPQWAWCPFAAEGAPGVEAGCGGGRAQRQVVEGARDGARGS